MLKFDKPISEYKKVRISLDTAYKWGRGYTSSERHEFESEVYPKLEMAGYSLQEPKMTSACPEISRPDGTYLYLHPMSFTGYLKKEDLDKIVKILKTCSSINDVDVATEDVYKISNGEYERILKDNGLYIYNWIKNNPRKDEFDFVRENRIPRVGDKPGLSSFDCDVAYVAHFMDFLDIMKQVEQQKKSEN